MTDIKEFSKQLTKLIDTTEAQAREINLYKNQLLILMMNQKEGKFNDLDYDDLSKVDWEKVGLAIGNTSCCVLNKDTNERIKSWDEVPLIQK